jgi:hypothetical protein
MPELSGREKEEMCAGNTDSDSFYFVDGKLVMHNKARYEYADEN